MNYLPTGWCKKADHLLSLWTGNYRMSNTAMLKHSNYQNLNDSIINKLYYILCNIIHDHTVD